MVSLELAAGETMLSCPFAVQNNNELGCRGKAKKKEKKVPSSSLLAHQSMLILGLHISGLNTSLRLDETDSPSCVYTVHVI